MADEYDDRPDEHRMELLMPFTCVVSAGGPFDDKAFTAGVQLGRIWQRLERDELLAATEIVDEALEAQCDLAAMAHGFTCDVLHRGDGWMHVGFTRAQVVPS